MQRNAPAVQDIHAIRHRLYKRRRHMSWQQKKQDIERSINRLLNKAHLKQVEIAPGVFKLEAV